MTLDEKAKFEKCLEAASSGDWVSYDFWRNAEGTLFDIKTRETEAALMRSDWSAYDYWRGFTCTPSL